MIFEDVSSIDGTAPAHFSSRLKPKGNRVIFGSGWL